MSKEMGLFRGLAPHWNFIILAHVRLRLSSVGVLVVKVFGFDSGAEIALSCSPTAPTIWQLHKPQLDQHYEVGKMSGSFPS